MVTYSMERWDNCSEYSLVVTTRTGFGDRILDTWSTYAVFALLPLARPLADRPCRILWHSNDSPLRGKRPDVQREPIPKREQLQVGDDESEKNGKQHDEAAHRGRSPLVHVTLDVFLDELSDVALTKRPDGQRGDQEAEEKGDGDADQQ